MSGSSICKTSKAITPTPYFSDKVATKSVVSTAFGFVVLIIKINGLFNFCNSSITCSSTFSYSSLVKSPKLPSLLITIPMLECDSITFSVPSFAASSNGIASLNHGV